ncbi:MAG: flagellar basal body P-ring protein FlgI [Phycisphaerales bacterium]|nr:flagellar basal body P-ring protein FlgI [Phycisphaerales bacterium]MCB9856743.1 flagellar basal body P-ring protein FlgI [Phycisphaerales bacterium]MCB9862130.1 flagellar basal body P-ring protein FlgI [Phycisphaerales bacterium]
MRNSHWLFPVALATIVLLGTGCNEADWAKMFDSWREKDRQPEADLTTEPDTIARQNTIGPLVNIQGMERNAVRGFGLVVDLVDTGGSDGPEVVRNYLVKEIRRRAEIGSEGINASEFLDSKDTAMVELEAYIPGGAQKNERFDVRVRALGTETTSLAGGRLVLASLQVWAATPSGVLSSKPQAIAAGPVFVSPFDRQGRPSEKVDLRRGIVLGGGIVKEPRKVRLVLNDPRHSVARAAERAINSRWGGSHNLAVGESSSYIELHIPHEMIADKRLFLERMLYTPLNSDPAFLDSRLEELINALESDTGNPNAIGLALEALGKPVIPKLAEALDSKSRDVHYYAARTLLRLGEREGAIGVGEHAAEDSGKYQIEAIEELGRADRVYAAGEQLRRLLDSDNNEARIAAYLALRVRPHPAIKSYVLDGDNLVLDVIDCHGKELIYAQQSGSPRLALFGKRMMCRPPAIFPGVRSDSRNISSQLTADQGDRNLTLVYRNKRNGAISPPIKAPLGIPELVQFLGATPRKISDNEVRGFAIPYSEILDILSAFSETDAIRAEFIVEKIGKVESPGLEREETEYE